MASFSSEGRSTATTLLSVSAVSNLRKQGVTKEASKLLSFTDNRQDASLQAGHFNDFVQVALIRSGIYRALEENGTLTHANIATAVFRALNLPLEIYAADAVDPKSRAAERIRKTFIELLEYRIMEDLRRGWRVVQPNLEQVGLLAIEYDGLKEACERDEWWRSHPLLAGASPERRFFVAKSFLDFMRQALAIDAYILTPEAQDELQRKAQAEIQESWGFAKDELLRRASWFIIDPNVKRGENEWSLSARSALGKFLRSPETWNGLIIKALPEKEYHEEFLPAFIEALIRSGFLTKREDGNAVQVRIASLIWQKGSGEIPAPDPVRSKWLKEWKPRNLCARPIPFFKNFIKSLRASS